MEGQIDEDIINKTRIIYFVLVDRLAGMRYKKKDFKFRNFGTHLTTRQEINNDVQLSIPGNLLLFLFCDFYSACVVLL